MSPYRKVREGRKVRFVYCGSGERGARDDAERRARPRRSAGAEAGLAPPTTAPGSGGRRLEVCHKG